MSNPTSFVNLAFTGYSCQLVFRPSPFGDTDQEASRLEARSEARRHAYKQPTQLECIQWHRARNPFLAVVSSIAADLEHATQRRDLTGSGYVASRPVSSSLSLVIGPESLGIIVGPVSRQLGWLPMPLYVFGSHLAYSRSLCLYQTTHGINVMSQC